MKWWWDLIKNYRVLILPYITNCHFHVNIFMELLLVIFLWYIGTRFDKVNEHMRCLLVKEEYGLRHTWRKTVLPIHRNIMYTSSYKRVLYTSMHLHLELCQIARELNEIFGIQMTLEMINSIICVMRHCWFLYIHAQTKTFLIFTPFNWLDIQIWLLLNGIRIFCLNYACQSVSTKANEMKEIIHQLTDFLRYADIRDEIYQFTLQMMRRPLKFTGLGFFYFGNGLLRKFCLTVVTLIIIVIQMV
ncbi:putative gustatory receptor 28b [Polyergus mexicanus]|uniref:putative gustatory receptor 28b n=1 Tax=Polyergus mexicanus TaxID=615972 RepID=UPI0038B5DD83